MDSQRPLPRGGASSGDERPMARRAAQRAAPVVLDGGRPDGEKVGLGRRDAAPAKLLLPAMTRPERNRTDVHQPEPRAPWFFPGRDVGVEGLHGGARGWRS